MQRRQLITAPIKQDWLDRVREMIDEISSTDNKVFIYSSPFGSYLYKCNRSVVNAQVKFVIRILCFLCVYTYCISLIIRCIKKGGCKIFRFGCNLYFFCHVILTCSPLLLANINQRVYYCCPAHCNLLCFWWFYIFQFAVHFTCWGIVL